MPPLPLLLTPTPPNVLLAQVLQQTTYPTTLVIGSTRADFLARVLAQPNASHQLSTCPIHQVAIARHIRLLFVPTVSHLRAYLGIFDGAADANIPPPPATAPEEARQPLLIVYGFLDLHRDTSEWSAQGLSATAACVVDAAARTEFRAILVDPPYEEKEEGEEVVPITSASVVRAGGDGGQGSWTGRRVPVSQVLRRWFRPTDGEWYVGGEEERHRRSLGEKKATKK